VFVNSYKHLPQKLPVFLRGFLVIFWPVFDVFFYGHFCRNPFQYNGLNSGYEQSFDTVV
jgi:hypothetical protein